MPKKPTVPPQAMKYFQEMGRQGGLIGGKKRAAKLTPERRSEIARKAVQARWKKRRKKKA